LNNIEASRTFLIMSATHQQFIDMIPWWINGRLHESERLSFEDHLKHCDECRRDVANEQALAHHMNDDPRVEYAPGASLQSLLSRIDTESVAPTTVRRSTRQSTRTQWTRWLVAATIVEGVGIAILTGALLHDAQSSRSNSDANYRTVTSIAPAPTNASLRVIFAPTMTLNELGKLLQELRLEVVSGPSPGGVYALAISGEELLANELAALRSRPDVRFAEPIGESATTSR
jgi:Putative zinc-finger